MKSFKVIPIGVSLAASLVGAQPQPFLYLNAEPQFAHGPLVGAASQIVHVKYADLQPPDTLAQMAINYALDQINTHNTDADHICIWIQNFGVPTDDDLLVGGGAPSHPSSFYDDADMWGPPHGVVGQQGSGGLQQRRRDRHERSGRVHRGVRALMAVEWNRHSSRGRVRYSRVARGPEFS